MILGADIALGLRLAGLSAGVAAGVIAVYLARTTPPQMELTTRERPTWWWVAAIAVGAGFGWFGGEVGEWWLLPAVMVFGGVTLALTLIDLDHQLIPNRVLFPGMAVAVALLVVGAVGAGSSGDLGRGLLAAAVYFGLLLVVALVARGGLGMGDVKLALLLGLFLGFVGWNALTVGFVLAVLLGGVASILVLLFTEKGRDSKFAYGPYLVAGAWIGLFWGAQLWDWYLGNG